MKACALALIAVSALAAADLRQSALAVKALSDFERVQLAPRPGITDTEACLQSQAAALAVSPPEERSQLFYRKGFCTFAGAAATREPRQFQAAAAEFEKAVESWPERLAKTARHSPPEAVPSGLRAFIAVAHLRGNTEFPAARQELTAALASPSCNSNLTNSNVMPSADCYELLAAGTQWLGWLALRDNQLEAAARRFEALPASGWSAWVQGRRDFADSRFATAAVQFTQAISQWKVIWQGEGPTWRQALGPQPQLASALADLGGAQMLAGDLPTAILTLDAAIQADSANPHVLFLRARAKEISGRKDAALADYNLASRTAFAAARDLASGEAHLYRGIVLYRRQDFVRAEEEFASALNFEIASDLLPDARAWRHLAAVAAGSCGSARQSLNLALSTVSPYFPQGEARSVASACGTA